MDGTIEDAQISDSAAIKLSKLEDVVATKDYVDLKSSFIL